MTELVSLVNWFGTLAGVFGVAIAVYLQLINPRRCRPQHVMGLFALGSALVLVFTAAWNPNEAVVLSFKVVAILIFVTLEGILGYYVWKSAEAAPPHEVIASLFKDDGGGPA